MSKNIVIWVIVGIVIGSAGLWYFSGNPVTERFAGVSHLSGLDVGTDGLSLSNNGQPLLSMSVTSSATGAASIVSSPGGLVYVKQTYTSATTTPCSILSPAATSTPMFWTSQITVGTSTAMAFDLATSTTAFATTTSQLIKGGTTVQLASSAQGTFFWSQMASSSGSTYGNYDATGASTIQLAPSTWLVMKTGAGLGGYTFTGTCSARFLTP